MAFVSKSFKLIAGLKCCGKLKSDRIIRAWSSLPKISTINDVYSLETKGQIQVEGWITNVRKSKLLYFVDINDGSCSKKLQITIDKDKAPDGLNHGTSIEATGLLQTNKNNQIEVLVDNIKILGPCHTTDGYPFTQRMPYNPNHQREFLHLRPRTQTFSSLLRIRHKTSLGLHEVLDENGFCSIDVPVLTTNDCEGGGEVFVVKPDNELLLKEMIRENVENKDDVESDEVFFGNKTYLTVSGQLHLESAVRALKKVYSFGPIFRAENSKSRLHLSEFYMLEAEISFINNLEKISNTIEIFLKQLVDKMLNNYGEEIHSYFKMTGVNNDEYLDILNKIITEKFVTITYDEAFDILNKTQNKFKSLPRKGETLAKEHELYLVKHNNNVPVFIVEWPSAIKPFYMKSMDNSPDKVEALDLLCSNVGELCGGSIREDNYDLLKEKINKANYGSKLDWYLDLRRYGNVRTGGFGMGFERFLQLLLGIKNIKDTIPFPRWPHNCKL